MVVDGEQSDESDGSGRRGADFLGERGRAACVSEKERCEVPRGIYPRKPRKQGKQRTRKAPGTKARVAVLDLVDGVPVLRVELVVRVRQG